ncbi:MAG: menaquinone biosynthesis decarboxylase [Bacteroidales bacterium]|nr:menaquinone biosynthesis decarboxylase [Bacteroidales bacterium]
MTYRSLSDFVKTLENANELYRVHSIVSTQLEMTEIADRLVKKGSKAVLFENNESGFPVLLNAFASEKRMCLSLGVSDFDEIPQRIDALFKQLTTPTPGFLAKMRLLPSLGEVASWMPKTIRGRGACQEIVMESPDLHKLPVLTCWPHDGGPFITLPLVHTIHPETGHRNTGMYRVQVFDSKTGGMHWQLHKTGANHFEAYKKLGKKMPVSIALGGDPAYTYAATAPLPENIDEYLLAGFLRRKKVELVKCLTNELFVPGDADIIIEGWVDPSEDLILEGPFGDHTGYYSLADMYPRFHVECITHRRDAIYPATIVGIPPQEDEWLGKATERIFLSPIRITMNPEVQDMDLPVEGVFHNIALVSLKSTYAGQAFKVMTSLLGAGQMMFTKNLMAFNEDVDVHNYTSVMKAVSDRVDPLNHIVFSKGPVDVLDHASTEFAYGSKLMMDATGPVLYQQSGSFSEKNAIASFPEILSVNTSLLDSGISCLIIRIKKSRTRHIRELHQQMYTNAWMDGIRFVVYMEDKADINNLPEVVWRASNNLDPIRDCFFAMDSSFQPMPCMAIDATRKTEKLDGFKREWPNIVTMDAATILKVDERWADLGLGEFVESPSAPFLDRLYPGKAVAEED